MDALNVLLFLGAVACVSADASTTPKTSSYVFTVIKTEPYLTVREGKTGNSQFGGFIPAFLKSLKNLGAIPDDYKMQLVKDGRYGYFDDQEGRWVGLIGEVMVQSPMKTSVADVAAAPIQITAIRRNVVDFSTIWANVTLAMVTHVDNNFNTIEDVLESPFTLGGIEGGAGLAALSHQYKKPFSTMWSKVESEPDAKVASVEAGVQRARDGNYTVILENQFAEYLVNKHCELKMIDTKLSVQGYGFALTKDSPLKTELNRGIQKMVDDGSLMKLKQKYWKVPCVSGQPAVAWSPVVMLAVLASALLLRSS